MDDLLGSIIQECGGRQLFYWPLPSASDPGGEPIEEAPLGSWIEVYGDELVEEYCLATIMYWCGRSPSIPKIIMFDFVGHGQDHATLINNIVGEIVKPLLITPFNPVEFFYSLSRFLELDCPPSYHPIVWVNGVMGIQADNREELFRNNMEVLLQSKSEAPPTVLWSHWETRGDRGHKTINALRRVCNIQVRAKEGHVSIG